MQAIRGTFRLLARVSLALRPALILILPMPKIVRFHEVGDASVLKLEELPKPEPKWGQVLLKVEAGKGFALAFDPVAGPGGRLWRKAPAKAELS